MMIIEPKFSEKCENRYKLNTIQNKNNAHTTRDILLFIVYFHFRVNKSEYYCFENVIGLEDVYYSIRVLCKKSVFLPQPIHRLHQIIKILNNRLQMTKILPTLRNRSLKFVMGTDTHTIKHHARAIILAKWFLGQWQCPLKAHH